MTTATIPERTFRTMAELLHDLGDIPPERVLLDPPPGQATEADVVWLDDHADRLCELVDGVLVEKPMGLKESFLAMFIIQSIQNYILPRRLGLVVGGAGMMRILPHIIRIPDVAFIRRTEGDPKLPNQPVPKIAPTLAIEILSTSNTKREMERKLVEYFAAGTELVWIIDPITRTAAVHTSPHAKVIVDARGTLLGEPALPGFSLSLKELFDEMDRQFEP